MEDRVLDSVFVAHWDEECVPVVHREALAEGVLSAVLEVQGDGLAEPDAHWEGEEEEK